MPTQMLYLSQTEAAVKRSLITAEPIVDQDRKSRALLALQYDRAIRYQIEDLTSSYSHLYDVESLAEWQKQPKACYNIARAVGNALCTLYHDPVTREWEKKDAAWADAFGDFAPWWNRRLAIVDRRTFFGGATFVRPYVLEPGGPVKLAIYTADQIDVTASPDDTETLWQIVLTWTLGQGQSLAVHRLFLTAERMLWTVNDDIVPDPDYPDGKHPYGRIPGVLFTNDDSESDLVGEPADDLVIANRTLNRGVTCLNETVDFQGQSLMVTVMGDDTKRIKIGPRRRVNFNDPQGNLFFAAPNAPIEATISAANFNLALMCRARGIPDDAFLVERQGESGVAIVARRASLIDWRKRRTEMFRDRDAELTQLALLMREIHTLRKSWNGTDLPPSPVVSYTIPREPMDDAARTDAEMEMRHGVSSPADLVMAKNPGMTREDAEEQVRRNKRFMAELEMQDIPFDEEGGGGRAGSDEDEDEDDDDAA